MNGITIVSTNISSKEDKFYTYSNFYSTIVSAIVNMGIEKAHIIDMSDFYAHDKAELFRILSSNLDNYYNPHKEDCEDVFIIASSEINESILAMYKIDLGIETVGNEFICNGRLQSRNYIKDDIMNTAYEVSLSTILHN